MLRLGLHKNLTKVFTHLTIFLSIVSCNSDKQSVLDEVIALHPVPQIVPLNTHGGYSINPLTGDSILPLINSPGDTVITGAPVPVKGRVIDPNSVAKPKVIPAGKPKVIRIHQKEHKIPAAPTVIPLDIGSLEAFTPGKGDSNFVLINSTGDTIPTGVPIPINGKVVPCKQPQPTKALPPVMKDYASSHIKYLDVAQGMISSHVTSVLEDSRGNIWISTLRRGLSMYNGETFKHFTQMEGFSSNWIYSILEDIHGNLWFATSSGVSMYNGETLTHFTQEEGLSHNNVACILEDSQGNLWFGSWGGGVSKFNGESIIHFTPKEGLSDNYVFSILEDSQGNLWFGTNGGGVSIYNGNCFVHLSQKQGLINNRVWSILEESQGSIWIGTDDGLCKYDGETLTHFTQNEGLCDNHIRSILEDSRGNLWFGTHGGVSMYNGESFTDLTQNEGLSSNRIIGILEDSHGNLWFCTEQGGVSISYNNAFTYPLSKEVLSETGIQAIMEDSYGNYWFGTWGGGVDKYNGETVMNFTKKEGLISDIIRCILEDSQGNIWFGTFEGLCKYNGENFTHFTQNEGLSDNRIRSILEDSHGNLWFGTREGGVSMYDGTSFTHFTTREGLINDCVNSIIEDISGNLWFGTDGGVSIYDGETFTHFTRQEGLSDNYIRSILEDSDNNIWFSTFNGLIRMEFEQESDSRTIKIHNYGLQDGLKSIDFDVNNAILDSKNRIWWGSNKDPIVLDMSNITRPVKIPLMQLDRIDVNRQFIDYRHLDNGRGKKMNFNGVANFYNYPLNLELPYKQNNLSFYFSALDWSAAQKLKYSYVMVGLDDKWSAPTEEAYVEYGNMPYGRYTFKVRAIGAAKKWSKPFEYTFSILPPFWLTWWAYMIYGIILLLLVRWYRRFLIRREKINSDLRIKEVEVSKMQELDHLKSRFFANISHEFRTPLTLIQGPVEELRKLYQGNLEGSIQLFQTVKRNTQRLMDLINQLLDISKLETGNIKLQVSRGNLVEFVKDLVLSFLSLAEYKKIKYEYDLSEELRLIYFDHDKIEKIITNLISNAFKFTSEGGKISVGIQFHESSSTYKSDSVVLKVSDTGKGIPTEKLDKIFKRFYRISDSDTSEIEGTGLGLSLTKELVELYRGKISVESELGVGSSFTVSLPVSVAQFREEEIVTYSPVEDKRKEHVASIQEHKDCIDTDSTKSLILDASKDKSLILIVEDNADLRKYICRTLERTYSIITAKNGKLGWEKAQESIPDLVISDVMMPEMDGMEMCKRLKSDEITDHIPVIILTARADRYSKLEGLESGADDYIIKPFDMEELEVRIKNLIVQRCKLRKKFRLDFLLAPPEMGLPPMDQFIARLLEIHDQHIADSDFKMSQLSSELNLSQSQVQRKVMAITGYTPTELFRNHRLKKAAVFFRSGHIHVAQVMHRVGFNTQSYFTKSFAELFEMTPSQFIADCKLGKNK